jgi:lipopolysaccharide/colanic/teichoic acid biosynthesis glycosyltransferase
MEARPQEHLLSRRPAPATSRRAIIQPFGPLRYRWYVPVKSACDFTLALGLLLLTAPVILLAAALVKLTSRGPAFYLQTRVGQYGRHFTIFKLRTMVDKCESLTGPRWSIPGDPRVTRIGQFLRKAHIDELPQLINVLRGDMSLLGPRPERPEFLPTLEREIPRYRDRLVVRPGMSGLAQLQLEADTDIESVCRKLTYDLYYIRNLSPWLDARVLACTACYAAGVPFRIAGRLLGVPNSEHIEGSAQPEELLALRQAA